MHFLEGFEYFACFALGEFNLLGVKYAIPEAHKGAAILQPACVERLAKRPNAKAKERIAVAGCCEVGHLTCTLYM